MKLPWSLIRNPKVRGRPMSETLLPLAAPEGKGCSIESKIVANQGKGNGDTDPAWDGDLAALLQRHIASFEESEMASMEARELAERDRDYYLGRQWTAEEAAVLRRRRQPLIHNNVIGRKIDLLLGMERRGRNCKRALSIPPLPTMTRRSVSIPARLPPISNVAAHSAGKATTIAHSRISRRPRISTRRMRRESRSAHC